MEKKKGRREGRERGRVGGRERKEGRKKGQKEGKKEERKKRKNDNYDTIEKDGNQIVDYVLPEEAGVYPGQGDTQRMFCSTCIFSNSSPGFLL